jgi:hypothetical protein
MQTKPIARFNTALVHLLLVSFSLYTSNALQKKVKNYVTNTHPAHITRGINK